MPISAQSIYGEPEAIPGVPLPCMAHDTLPRPPAVIVMETGEHSSLSLCHHCARNLLEELRNAFTVYTYTVFNDTRRSTP